MEPVPEESPNGVTRYAQGNNPTEKFIPSWLEDPSKHNHGIPFTSLAEAALNKGKHIKFSESQKARIKNTKQKQIVELDLSSKKKKQNVVILS